jgi:hypothetical protein
VSVLLPAKPLLWEGFQNSTLVSSWRRYFAFSLAVEQKLDPQGKYIFAGEGRCRLAPVWVEGCNRGSMATVKQQRQQQHQQQ